MSTSYEYAKGNFHIHVKLTGDLAKIDLFHGLMEKIDGAWPWGTYRRHQQVRVCRKCKGLLLANPRFAPQDLKAAGEQAGIRVKIYVFSPQENCFTGLDFTHTEGIDNASARVLYSHKPKRITALGGKLYIGTDEAPRLIETIERKVIELPPVTPKDSQLVN